ncbi:MAG: response regulator [Deltaproteobacteria bacterium]|nr:response regulator [Deltaproteobacteria bacterium]
MNAEKKTQILILDDEPIVCRRLRPSLEKSGYEVETFIRSDEALERVREKHFDVVITDIKMEGLDGLGFLSEVKKFAPETEVIVITGFATMETAKRSFQEGVFDFVAKPFSLSEIQGIVKKAEQKALQNS